MKAYSRTKKHGRTGNLLFMAVMLFVAAMALKLMFPYQTEEAYSRLRQVIGGRRDYVETLREVGERLTGDGGVLHGITALFSDKEETEIETATAAEGESSAVTTPDGTLTASLPEATADAQTQTETEGPADAAQPEATDPPETTEPPEATAVPEAVETFLESQAEFSDYAVPANVSYDMPSLPFQFTSPVSGETSSGFGYRLHPIQDVVKFHYGTDFAVWSGVDILAFADGTVSMVGWDDGYGNYVIIDHDSGWQTLYAHCGTVYVSCGQTVSRGEKIALVGATGEVTGPHLHFELMCGGIYYNPEFWLA